MARKVVRDIEKKGPTVISLKDEPEDQKPSGREKLLDISEKTLKKTNNHSLKDIESGKAQGKVMFFRVDPWEELRADRFGEALRIAAAGTMILLILNLINVYNRGINFKTELIASAEAGYNELIQAGDQAAGSDFGAAEMTFTQAQKTFRSAQDAVAFLRVNQEYFFTREKTLESIQGLLNAAQNISSAGQNFARGIQNLQQLPQLFIEENAADSLDAGTSTGKKSLTEKLKEDLKYVETAAGQLASARRNLDMVSAEVLPPTFREKLASAKSKLEKLDDLLTKTREKIPAFLDLLGDRYPHRYLVLLQNDTEARPTGGFIGSYVIADLNDGYITKMDFHDVYELDGQLQEYIEPPADIAMVAENWRMRDSNYSPDFAISAEKAAWFLQKENGPSVDTVIAINQSFIADLLKLTGPIRLGGLKASLDENNFQLILSYIIESKAAGAENPKQIMAELVPAFRGQLLTKAPLDQILKIFLGGVMDEKILFYSRNEKVQKLFDDFGMTKRILPTGPGEDYLNVTITSIGGNKSDRYIEQKIEHDSLIQTDGSVVDEVTVSRKHTWTMKDLEEWETTLKLFGYGDLPQHIQQILGSGSNKVFVRVYVPIGSKLLSAQGVNTDDVITITDNEIQKQYFMVQMTTDAGKEKSVALSYILPFRLSLLPADAYKLQIQKQPAINESYFEKKVFFKPGLQSYREYPDAFAKTEDGSLQYAGLLGGDLYLSTLVGN
ncbi:DUF4012 domain-containing protein [Patescibacteria group bacterium]|nr:DUF4012 domain-containing protein [Patescibacteria group bacterium]MBU1703713.1 DUF4012 domain-containing protein [Patescibacteria group bacterium]MBU1953536.1 DUF4012 domain-containing protein [Patescibacteria group bacterium]